MVSNKEQEFKEALNNGKLAEAFLLAMNSAVELKITTWVESSQEDSTQEKIQTPEIEKKDTNPSQDKETPGHSLKSRVNLIQGEIENKIGDQFLNNDQLAKILPFHFHQVSLSSHNFRNNLQSLQKLFGFLAALNQQENSEQLLEILNLENQFITENPTEIPLPPLELGTKTPSIDVFPIPSIPSVKPQEKTISPEQKIESQREIKAEIKAEIKEEILEEIKDKIADDSPIYPAPEMPVSDLDEDDWEESTFIPSALSFEDDNAQLETDIDEEDDDSFEILSLDDLEASSESEEDWGDVDSSHDNLELEEDDLRDEDLPPLKFQSSQEEDSDSDIPIIELEEIAEEDWGDVDSPRDDLEMEDQGDIPILNLGDILDDGMESQEDIPASELAQIPEEDGGDVDSPYDNLGLDLDEEIPETDIPVIELDDEGDGMDWGEVNLSDDESQLGETSFDFDLDREETSGIQGEGWEETNDILELESPSEESDFESADLRDMDSIADFDFGEEVSSDLELDIEETPALEENWEETDQVLDLESSDNDLDIGYRRNSCIGV
jgi:pilus assembly protein FimV